MPGGLLSDVSALDNCDARACFQEPVIYFEETGRNVRIKRGSPKTVPPAQVRLLDGFGSANHCYELDHRPDLDLLHNVGPMRLNGLLT